MTARPRGLGGPRRRYLGALLDPSTTSACWRRQEATYFLQAAGEPLRLRYVKAPYGPYAENLRHVLREGGGPFDMRRPHGGDAPDKPLALVPGAVEEAERYLAVHAATHERLDRTAALVEGFETPYGLELLATVHWVVTQEGAKAPDQIAGAVHGWNTRKRQFTADQIALASERLQGQGWLSVAGAFG